MYNRFTYEWLTVLHQLHNLDGLLVLVYLDWYFGQVWIEILLCDCIVGT